MAKVQYVDAGGVAFYVKSGVLQQLWDISLRNPKNFRTSEPFKFSNARFFYIYYTVEKFSNATFFR